MKHPAILIAVSTISLFSGVGCASYAHEAVAAGAEVLDDDAPVRFSKKLKEIIHDRTEDVGDDGKHRHKAFMISFVIDKNDEPSTKDANHKVYCRLSGILLYVEGEFIPRSIPLDKVGESDGDSITLLHCLDP